MANQAYIFPHPVPPKGRVAIVTFAGRAAVDAEGATDERARGGQQNRVVLAPRRWCQVPGKRKLLRGDGGQKARRTEESTR